LKERGEVCFGINNTLLNNPALTWHKPIAANWGMRVSHFLFLEKQYFPSDQRKICYANISTASPNIVASPCNNYYKFYI